MLFNSYIFVLAFLPLTVIVYFAFNRFQLYKTAQAALICASLVFYGYFNQYYLLLIGGSILANYGLSRLMMRQEIANRKKTILAAAIVFNVGLIFYFKYYDFFCENINAVFGTSFELKNILLPLGISFYTIQQISYAVDSYKGETMGYSFLDYALFVTFFPQLVAGPIVLHKEMIPQFQDIKNKAANAENLANGLHDFAVGLFKKVIVADTFGRAVAWGFDPQAIPELSTMSAALVMLSYTLQIYFDFSGYCDMAMGIASMFNIRLPQNFNSPYQSCSILEFWKRWHMSLTRFFREYVYFSLGGSRKGEVRTCVNIMIIYLLSGIWHGANWTFLLWGGVHGIACVANRLGKKNWEKIHPACQWMLTFLFVNVMWVFFRADTIAGALVFVKRLLIMSQFNIPRELIDSFILPEAQFLIDHTKLFAYLNNVTNAIWVWIFILPALWTVLNFKNCSAVKHKTTIARGMMTIVCIVWSVISFSGISTFLYFNF